MIDIYVANLFQEIIPVGSRVTCNPAPVGTDQDFLCLCKPQYDLLDVASTCLNAGHQVDMKYGTVLGEFLSTRSGDINLIATTNRTFFDKFIVASKTAKFLNLLNKDHRIALFDAVIKGEPPNGIVLTLPQNQTPPIKRAFSLGALSCRP